MKIEKNKIVFAIVLLSIVLFIGGYAMYILGDDEEPTLEHNKIPVPKLEDKQEVYESKLDALNAIQEERQINAPSIYNERLLDSMGVFDPDLLDKEKMRLVDSIYNQGKIDYSNPESYRDEVSSTINTVQRNRLIEKDSLDKEIEASETGVATKELSLEHQLFFASHPVPNDALNTQQTDAFIYVRVDGTQTVKNSYRLQMRLLEDAYVNNRLIPKNTPIYGFVSFKANRTLIAIENINHHAVILKAYDYQDGSEGIYVQNSFRAQASNEVIGDIIDDINITGVPQISGVRKIFKRNHKNVKVTVSNNYKLILKPSRSSPSMGLINAYKKQFKNKQALLKTKE